MEREGVELEQIAEDRQEVCSVASKIVSVKILRQRPKGASFEGEIIGFECNNGSPNCESRCTYRMLLEDF